ncbi:hypothetical protein Tco_0309747 [Tanacetum coccineum]|uniref:Uncharacterized protein n=1 Tax=Tanacetum coccineum TaxID=301880 RepID=A0ABQ5HA69_9ASTR
MVMSGMTNVAKPRSSDARCNILASFGESKGISTIRTPSLWTRMLDVEEEVLVKQGSQWFFGVPLSSLKEIDDFTRELEAGNNQLWLGQTMDIRNWISDLIVEKCLELQKKAIMVENKPVPGRRFRLMALVG